MKTNTQSSTRSDIASLLLRLTVGPMIITHGYNKIFGQGGLAGTTRWFNALGLRPAAVHARLAAGTEIASGAAMTLGVATPLPNAALIGLMATAAQTDHKDKGFFVFKGGWEYVGVVGAVSAVMAILGPGRFSIDGIRGRQRAGLLWALLAVAAGLANSAALLKLSYRPEPPEPQPESQPEPDESPS